MTLLLSDQESKRCGKDEYMSHTISSPCYEASIVNLTLYSFSLLTKPHKIPKTELTFSLKSQDMIS